MYSVLRLEDIGRENRIRYSTKKRLWVAELTGFSEIYNFERVFLRGEADYSEANGSGTRGVYIEYILEQNRVYEVCEPVSWKTDERYFCIANMSGGVEKISKEQAIREICSNDFLRRLRRG